MIALTSNIWSEIHPIVVHWPFTLASLAVGADGLSRRRPNSTAIARAGWMLLGFLVLAMLLADATGFLSQALLSIPKALDPRIARLIFYALSATATGMLALWRRTLIGPDTVPDWTAGLALWATWLLLALGDHAGYVLVYRYGLGTETGIPPSSTLFISMGWVVGAVAATLAILAMIGWWRRGRIPARRWIWQALNRVVGSKGGSARVKRS